MYFKDLFEEIYYLHGLLFAVNKPVMRMADKHSVKTETEVFHIIGNEEM